ncbi:TetR/AcrR family transcriptional regulator [Amycolatopsis anabasis]|uniref:TetR/AcrR family transcriptional regulator n=1 Tax=Amycolatopsis anabasis TaxID=1840409 RepID=UPI00131C0150|nr:TetR/AcrR family transcriptional regulator [Amycolatopsis anabasis]
MGRPPTHTTDNFLDAAIAIFAEDGVRGVTMTAVARRTGAPSGSIYHRFPDRAALLAAVWLRTVHRFHTGFLEALDHEPALEAAENAAKHTIAWCRKHPQEAAILYTGKRAFSPDDWSPKDIKESNATDKTLQNALQTMAGRLKPATQDEVLLALVDLPYAVARRHLANGQPPPPRAVDLVARTARSILAR